MSEQETKGGDEVKERDKALKLLADMEVMVKGTDPNRYPKACGHMMGWVMIEYDITQEEVDAAVQTAKKEAAAANSGE